MDLKKDCRQKIKNVSVNIDFVQLKSSRLTLIEAWAKKFWSLGASETTY